MRKIVLLLSFLISAFSYAEKKFIVQPSPLPSQQLKESKALEVNKPDAFSLTERISLSQREKQKEIRLKEISANTIRKFTAPALRSNSQTGEAILDSIIITDFWGYDDAKQEFVYDDKGNLLTTTNFYMNYQTSKWDVVETFTYKYDANGNFTYQEWYYSYNNYTEGNKYEITYENGVAVEEIISLNFGEGWEYSKKNSFSYDERGYINEWIEYNYQDGKWENSSKTIFDFDNQGRRILLEPYYWAGEAWLGAGDRVVEAYDEDGNQLLWLFGEWQSEEREWLDVHKYEQEFENGKITLQQESFWNAENNTWNGGHEVWGEIIRNNKTIFEYDGQGRQTLEMAYHMINNVWVEQVSMEFEYTPLENGDTRCVRETYFHTAGKVNTGTLTVEYNKDGEMVYRFEVLEGIKQYEEIYAYDERGNMVDELYYFYENDIRYPEQRYVMEYDENNNLLRREAYLGLAEYPMEFGPFRLWTYEYENNVEVKRLGHMPDKVVGAYEWYAFIGEEKEYDFSISLAELFIPGGYEFPYKLDRQIIYEALVEDPDNYVVEELELSSYRGDFYYTVKNGSSIEEVKENTFSIYPNPATDIIYINSTAMNEVNLYSIAGTKLLQTTLNQIDLSGFAPGVYIIEVNGEKTKVIKK